MLSLIEKIIKNSPRQLEGEEKTRVFIIDFLRKNKAPFKVQNFSVQIPQFRNYFLFADKQNIQCMPCSFKSGLIRNKEYLSNPLRDSAMKNRKAITFNPLCKDISLHTFYFEPALAIDPKDVAEILKAKKIKGGVFVNKILHQTANILVGNIRNPKNIIFTHYDSINKGTVDNASGTALILQIIQEKFYADNLFVLSGCEELSFSEPVYWGYGYRIFEKRYLRLLRKCKKIIIVDCVGNGNTQIFDKNNLGILKLAFPIQKLEKFKDKIQLISGDTNKLMEVYHSDLDDMTQIKIKYLKQAFKKLKSLII